MLRAGRYSGYETGANHFVSARSPRLPALAHSDGTLGRVSAFHAATALPLYLIRPERKDPASEPACSLEEGNSPLSVPSPPEGHRELDD